MKKLIVLGVLLAGCSPDKGETWNERIGEYENTHPKKYSYEPAISTLAGELRTERFWGPPGYGEDTLTDSKEMCAVLVLEAPVGVVADSSNELDETITAVKKIQLASTIKLDPYVGKQVIIKGKFFSAQTGHHYTPVLLDVIKIEAR